MLKGGYINAESVRRINRVLVGYIKTKGIRSDLLKQGGNGKQKQERNANVFVYGVI